ncbi:MAG: peroxiredoxin [Planctomycetota bacterium]
MNELDRSEAKAGYPLPRLNEAAPDFEAFTTHGPKRLEDWCGRWLLFFSHPGDFTPVCTTEFVELARRHDEFQALGCDLLGLSVDSRWSHIAWLRWIEERLDVAIPFPVIEDVGLEIARRYGMIQPGESATATVRTVFAIDPDGIVRAMSWYPMAVGRSVDELLRMMRALVTTHDRKVATPEGWQPGQDTMLMAPETLDEALRRREDRPEAEDWFLCLTGDADETKESVR